MIPAVSYPLLRAITLACLLFVPGAAMASPQHPDRAEVMDIYLAMDFRNAMIDDPANVAAKARTPAARTALQSMNAAMDEWGSGLDGWRYLMGASVYAATGVGEETTFVMFYNPWVDTAVITQWQDMPNSIDLLDIEWLPGEILRGADIEPMPAWQHGAEHPSLAMVAALADTVDGFEARFADPAAASDWRDGLGLTSRTDIETFLSPLIALRVHENQLRLFAIEYSVEGEDPLLQPMREAIVELITTAVTEGFGPLLAQAKRTPANIADVLAMIQPETMQGLAPVAYLADDDEVMIYFASPLTADFALAAVYEREGPDLRLRVLDFIPYAAAYQAARSMPVAQPFASPEQELRPPQTGGSTIGKALGAKKN